MDKDLSLLIAGGSIALISSLISIGVRELFEHWRTLTKRTHEVEDKKRDHQLQILKEKYESALKLLGDAVRIVETSRDSDVAFRGLDALNKREGHFFIRVRLTNEIAQEHYSIVARYHRIKENDETWQAYRGEVVFAARQLSEMYDREREKLFKS